MDFVDDEKCEKLTDVGTSLARNELPFLPL